MISIKPNRARFAACAPRSLRKFPHLDLTYLRPYPAHGRAMSDAPISTTPQVAPAPITRAVDDKTQLSPAMRQYQQFKSQHPGYVLFFRMGDFYEMFWEDARLASKVLGVALTSRSRGGLGADDAIPMAGIPFHSVESYLRKMIAAGHTV